MGRRKKTPEENIAKSKRPGSTPEARENQLISLAVDLAEQQLRDGTASSQVITHYLKLGTTMSRLERDKLKYENELLQARTNAIKSAERIEALYADAIVMMRTYSGQETEDD